MLLELEPTGPFTYAQNILELTCYNHCLTKVSVTISNKKICFILLTFRDVFLHFSSLYPLWWPQALPQDVTLPLLLSALAVKETESSC